MASGRLRACIAVVAAYGASIFVLGLLPALGLYHPKFPYEDIYFPYFLVAGPVVWAIGASGAAHCATTVKALLPPPAAGWMLVIVLPGLFDFLLGSLQWIAIVLLVGLLRRPGVGSGSSPRKKRTNARRPN